VLRSPIPRVAFMNRARDRNPTENQKMFMTWPSRTYKRASVPGLDVFHPQNNSDVPQQTLRFSGAIGSKAFWNC